MLLPPSSFLLLLFCLLLCLLLPPPLSANTFLSSTPLTVGRFRSLFSRAIRFPSGTVANFEVTHTNAISLPSSLKDSLPADLHLHDDAAVLITVYDPVTLKFTLVVEHHPSSLALKVGPVAGCVERYSGKHGVVLSPSNTSSLPLSHIDTAAVSELLEESGHSLSATASLYRLFPSPPSTPTDLSLSLPSSSPSPSPVPSFMDKYSCTQLFPYLLITSSPPTAPEGRDAEEEGMTVATYSREEIEELLRGGRCTAVAAWGIMRALDGLKELGY